jgi:hypothetical protein
LSENENLPLKMEKSGRGLAVEMTLGGRLGRVRHFHPLPPSELGKPAQNAGFPHSHSERLLLVLDKYQKKKQGAKIGAPESPL